MKVSTHRPRQRGPWTISGWTIQAEVSKYDPTDSDNWPHELRVEARLAPQTSPKHPSQLVPYGGHIFVRGKLRKRYLVFRVVDLAQRQLRSTGMEIRYNRRVKRWTVFERDLSGEFGPRNGGYPTLGQAKASISLNLLEQMAAEA